ncbi:MAG: hypothetical protein ACI37R_01375 [Candidatus Avigastranaerophilus sp.]
MYIIEKCIKLYLNITKKNPVPIVLPETEEVELEDIVTCKHNFMPIDSTGKILACSKCGYVIRKDKLKKKS